ncbi:MAG TPA: hypothetical protein EYP78_01415 [Candidatus Omnitrophica bacterium]|nr:hypothetical protein [Candidatus Omnitrophota bacterium]
MRDLLKLLVLLFFIVPLFLCEAIASEDEQESLPAFPGGKYLNWEVKAHWKEILLPQIPLPFEKVELRDGNVEVLLTIQSWRNGILYKATGKIEKCKIYLPEWKEEVHNIKATFTLKDKRIDAPSVEGKFRDIPFTAKLRLSLTPPYPFEAEVKAKNVTIEDAFPFLPFLKPYRMIKAGGEVEATIRGTVPLEDFEGILTFQEASLYSVGMSNVRVSFNYRDSTLEVKDLSVHLGEGRISGEGQILLKDR